jgi:catechol-2,3-dioxygenase
MRIRKTGAIPDPCGLDDRVVVSQLSLLFAQVSFPWSAGTRRLGATSSKSIVQEIAMAMLLGHVHIKTGDDPQKVAQFYIDNFGATLKRETPGRGCQLDLHGVQLNVTTTNPDQNHEQHVGIEHIAIETDDYAGAVANLKKNGAQIADDAQMELIEKV